MAEHCKISAAIVPETEEKSYVVKIDGYSRTKGLLGEYVTSPSFSVRGHNWVVKYYPNGNNTPGYISVYLVLDSVDKAKFRFSLLDKDRVPVPSYSRTSAEHIFLSKGSHWGFIYFIEKADLEGSLHLRGDCFRIRCDVTVMKDIHSEQTKGNQFVVVPPSDLRQHLGDLLKNIDGAHVTIQVGGERLSAHRSVLAARSSVFKAEFFSAMKEKVSSPIEVSDMESDVFKLLLHFIYTDSLPVPEMTHEGEARRNVVMAGHLLVAADRYNIKRLKLICEHKLCSHIDSNMVGTSLVLAEQHSCRGLKEACLQFLASPSNLEAMMASDGYEHLKSSCPSVLKELIARLLPAELKASKDIIMEI